MPLRDTEDPHCARGEHICRAVQFILGGIVAGEILRFLQVPFLVSLGAIAAISAVVGLRNRDSRWSLSGRRKFTFWLKFGGGKSVRAEFVWLGSVAEVVLAGVELRKLAQTGSEPHQNIHFREICSTVF